MAESPSTCVRVKPLKARAANGHRNHCLRLTDYPDHVDCGRTISNTTIVPMPPVEDVSAECLRRRQAAFVPTEGSGAKSRMARTMGKNTTPVISGLITFSTNAQPAINCLSVDDQNRRFQEAAELVATELETSLCGLVVHRDESAVHAHFALHGFGENGDSISRKLKKATLSKLQDLGASAYADIGIHRGKYIGLRIKDGDPKHKIVNRTVHQLHHDLPIELAAAEQRLRDMQGKVDTTIAKLDAATADADDKNREIDKLRKQLDDRTTEIQRLDALVNEKGVAIDSLDKLLIDKKAELRAVGARIELPEPKTRTFRTKPQKNGRLSKGKQPETQTIRYYDVPQVQEIIGSLKSAAQTAQERHMRLAREVKERTEGYQYVQQEPCQSSDRARLDAIGGMLVERDGLRITDTEKQVTVPPQELVTSNQIASVLYRESFKKWSTAHFTVTDEVAEKIVIIALEDGRTGVISFSDQGQCDHLERAIKEADKPVNAIPEAAQKLESPKIDIFGEDDDEYKGPSLG